MSITPIERRLVPIPGQPNMHRTAYFQNGRELPRWLGKLRHVIQGLHPDGYDEYSMLADAFKMISYQNQTIALLTQMVRDGKTFDQLTESEQQFFNQFIGKIGTSNAWGLMQHAADPTSMDRVFDRQEQITEIMTQLNK